MQRALGAILVSGLLVGWSSAGHAQGQSATAPGSDLNTPSSIDSTALEPLLLAQGFQAPEAFKALVGLIDSAGDAPPTIRWFDYRGTAHDLDDWWPASSVKLYAAIAALERARALGFPASSVLTFHEEDSAEPPRARLDVLVRRALIPSHNLSFDRLVEFVGFDTLHREFFTERNGLAQTVFLRAYGGRHRHPETGHSVNRHSPAITIERGRRSRTLPARDGRSTRACPDQGNCTTLRELAEAMRRVMLHEQLPAQERFALGDAELQLLRDALEAERAEQGQLLVDSLREGFGGGSALRVFHKPGYAYRWSSDVMFLRHAPSGSAFLVAAAAWPGRRVLDPGLRAIGAVLASGKLGADPAQAAAP